MKMVKKFSSIQEVRNSIDKLDLKIMELISQRKQLVEHAVKHKSKEQIVDQKRIDDILHNLSMIAEKKCLPKSMIIDIWRAMIKGFINYEKENFDKIKKD